VITDVKWICLETSDSFVNYVGTSSMDGSVKIWNYEVDTFVPIYEHFFSKKWVHSLDFDHSINALFFNMEGKNCPQKILYFRPFQYEFIQDNYVNLSEGDDSNEKEEKKSGKS
jgi:hypothetical protein